jgi:hypothetical protein
MPNNFDPRALLLRAMGKAQDASAPLDEAEPEAVAEAEGPTDAEKFAHHRTMARKAGSPAARALHKKLMAHHKIKMGK